MTDSTRPRYGRFTLQTTCVACGADVDVQGPTPRIVCSECGNRAPVPPAQLVKMLRTFRRSPANTPLQRTNNTGGQRWSWTATSCDAAPCPVCDHPLRCDEAGAGAVRCENCHSSVRTREVMATLRDEVPEATLLIYRSSTANQPADAAKVLAFPCESCGSELTLMPSTPRKTSCLHCRKALRVPDEPWRALHGEQEQSWWSIRFNDTLSREVTSELPRETTESARTMTDSAWAPLILAWAMTIPSVAVAGATVSMWVIGTERLGFGSTAFNVWLGGSAVALLLSWLLGNVAVTAICNHPIGKTLSRSALLLAATAVPVLGMVVGGFAAYLHASDRAPGIVLGGSSSRNPRGTGWPLAVLFVVTGPYCTVLVASLAGLHP